jgi:hypothetical protein
MAAPRPRRAGGRPHDARTRDVPGTATHRAAGAAHGHGSAFIHRLHWFVELHAWQHNAIFAVLAASPAVGNPPRAGVEAWRRAHGRHVREWLLISGEFEALASLSAYRYEHPEDRFPTSRLAASDTRGTTATRSAIR